MALLISRFRNLRAVTVVLSAANAVLVILGFFLFALAYPSCDHRLLLPFAAVSFVAAVRIVTTVRTGVAQEATAMTILESTADSAAVVDTVIRHERRMRYKRWLWWTRFAMFVTALQFSAATYLVYTVVSYVSHDPKTDDCIIGLDSSQWEQHVIVLFMIMLCSVTILQCFTGSDVLHWRSYYATKDDAWKAHYREVFDHGIREVLCCLGRVKYLSVLEEDEVFSVARLLGDLVTYRASGTGHLELLAGLALMQSENESPSSYEESGEAPDEQIQEAADLHKFAEAAYTGPLLDLGRNPFLFPCVWLYRQGILTPWMRNRRPKLDGDNWWRGHAEAFLKYVKLSPEVLRQGRVNQAKCEAAYFVLVLHHLRSVVIAIRGTETPEDLIIDGLCRECILSAKDLDGLINSNHVDPDLKQSVLSTFPHYGHSGIVAAARNLFTQIEGNAEDDAESDAGGLLSSLLGAGCECEGYNIRVVGHSLGGAIATLLGIRLYRKYPNLHVYAFGPLPCVDSIVAEACSQFVTSIVLNNEFSSRLSVGSILRLRAAAITALSQDSTADTAMIFRLARRFLYVSQYQRNRTELMEPTSDVYSGTRSQNLNNHASGSESLFDSSGYEERDSDFSLFSETDIKDAIVESAPDEFSSPFATKANAYDPVSEFMETVPTSENVSAGNPPELYLPGLIIHMVPQHRNFHMSLWKGRGFLERENGYKAYIANKESFKDIIVSPSMFLDHLPWRCHDAMQKVLEARCTQALNNECRIVNVY
ncbi:sn1-specific diacylglycerol lipase beta isoform X1 [Morus notabilis]|uniref:sn1-specific diacylglycerol lipase beta isoform X1 n=1 Tax=Morus notabilis TaxID=981085 RepID=UPI000CED5285|nr:sn1-specific diacylglycerol lipase beta isoform X1 [Morus notabilis]